MRNQWNALTSWPEFAKKLALDAERAGTFETGIESDKKQRGTSINTDLFGYDQDKVLIVLQVRECHFRPGRFNQVRKDYYLIGRNENGNVFAHPCESPARSKWALSSPENTVEFILCKIWECKPDELALIKRQGDIALIPSPLPAGSIETENEIVLRQTHKIIGKIMRAPNGCLFCEQAKVIHTKGQHTPIKKTRKGNWYRIQSGIRSETWGFSRPTAD